MDQFSISFAGAGRVAGALCRELYSAGFNIGQIVSESQESSHLLAGSCNALWSQELRFPDSSDVIIVSVPDHKLENVIENIECRADALVVHTAGSIGLDIFPERIINRGVLYPLQTFSKDRKVDFHDLPFFIEASDDRSSSSLQYIARSIGGKVFLSDTEHRQMLHLAAVFVCNFSNHMLTAGKELTLKSGFEFEVLEPLIRETISKALAIGPDNSQTGPAIRNDQNVIEKHLELLSFSSEFKSLYREISRAIIEYYNNT